LPIAIVAGLVAASPAAASPHTADPVAQASGGGSDVPPPLPALVRTRVRRTENALDRLTKHVDNGDATKAAATAKVIRRQLSAAWRGTKYYIKNAPPPVAGDSRVRVKDLAPRVRARVSGSGGGGPAIADAPTTTLGAFQLQDDVISTIVELTDGARVPLLDAMSSTLFYALDKRDAAIEDVHTLAPPSACASGGAVCSSVPAGRVRVQTRAHASGGAVAATFGSIMPTVSIMIDDELQQIDGLQSDAADLRPGAKKILRAAEVQALLSQRQITKYWPPVVGDD